MKLIHFHLLIQTLMIILAGTWADAAPEQLPKGVIGELSSDQFAVREKAYGELKKWAIKHLKTSPDTLYEAWRASNEPEAKTRCYTLMQEMAIQRQFGRGKGFVGIRMEEVIVPGQQGKPARSGVRVGMVLPDTPAAKAGLKVGDIVLGVDDLDLSKGVKEMAQRPGIFPEMRVVLKFSDYIQSKQPDDVITLHLLRGGKLSDLDITLMKRPSSADADPFGGLRGGDDTNNEKARFFKNWLKDKGE